MIVATLLMHGHGHQINWSDWRFVQLPAPGDVISVKDYAGNQHFAKVRETTYVGQSIHRDGEAEPSATITADWMELYPPAPDD